MKSGAQVWALAVPIILSNITVPLLGAVDTAVMGHMETAAYLGAVAVGALIFDYIYWGFGFLRLSTTGLAAQALGREDGNEVRAVLGRAAFIALIATLGLWIAQGGIFYLAASLIGASAEVESLAQRYFEIRIWAAPAVLINYALMGWLLAVKNTRAVFVQQVVTNLVNVVLDLWFVWGLDMTVEGVALATVLAQYSGLLVGIWFLRRELRLIDGVWGRDVIFQITAFKSVMSMNMDLLVRTVCLLSAFAWLTSQGAKQGDEVLAANAILLHFLQFASYALDGFAHAVEVLAAHALGRKRLDEFKVAVKQSTRLAFGSALVFCLVFALFHGLIIALFTDIQAVRDLAQTYVWWVVAMPLVAVWSFQFDGIYFGMTQTRVLRNMMVVSLLLYLPLSFGLQEIFGNHGLWSAFTIFMGLRAITLGLCFPNVRQKAFS